MYPYIILLSVLSISCILSYIGNFDRLPNGFNSTTVNKHLMIKITKGNILFVGICLYLILFSGFRYYVGTDYWAYIDAYNQLVAGSFYNWHFEIGFLTFMKAIAFFKVNYIWFFSIVSAAIIVPIAKTIKERSPYPIFSITLYVLFYFFCSSFNTPRQFIAIAIIVWSSKYIFNKSFGKYFIAVAIATLFHTSALLFIGLYFIGKIKITNKIKFAMVIFVVVVALFGGKLLTMLLKFFPQYAIYIGYESGSATSDLIVQILLLFSLEKVRSYIIADTERQQFNFFYSCTFFAIIISVMSRFNIMLARLGSYFYVFSIIAIPFCVYHAKRNKRLYYFMFLLLGIMICVRYLMHNNCGVVPYKLSPLIGL